MAALQIIALDTTTPQLRAPASGDTYAAPRAFALAPESLTGTSATSSLSIAQTWNTTGTPTAIDLNVTDTASNASSLLMNLRVGGTSRFSVGKAGNAIAPLSSAATPAYAVGANATGLYSRSATLRLNFAVNGLDAGVEVGPGLFAFASTSQLAWVTSTLPGSSPDLFLTRDAANTLALRNGVNAQAFNIYNTYTDASNYERVGIRWVGNDCIIGTQAAGTGSVRQLHHAGQTHRFFVGSGGTLFAWNMDASGNFVAQTGVYVGLTEMTAPAAPATNGVRIYAEDNGSGKTRLMALFATGAAQQLAVEP